MHQTTSIYRNRWSKAQAIGSDKTKIKQKRMRLTKIMVWCLLLINSIVYLALSFCWLLVAPTIPKVYHYVSLSAALLPYRFQLFDNVAGQCPNPSPDHVPHWRHRLRARWHCVRYSLVVRLRWGFLPPCAFRRDHVRPHLGLDVSWPCWAWNFTEEWLLHWEEASWSIILIAYHFFRALKFSLDDFSSLYV